MAAPFNPNNLVRSIDPLLSPADLKRFDPLLPQQEKLVAGFRASRGSHVLLLDGDLELSPDRTGDFLRRMAKSGADAVIGSKMHPESRVDYPWRRRVASRVYYGLVKLLVGLPVHDTQTGMKLFTRQALGLAFDRMVTKRFAFDLEVLAILHDAGLRVAEAPIERHQYQSGGVGAASTVVPPIERDVAPSGTGSTAEAALARVGVDEQHHSIRHKDASLAVCSAVSIPFCKRKNK